MKTQFKSTLVDAETKSFLVSLIHENKEVMIENFRSLDPYKMLSIMAKILPYIATKEEKNKHTGTKNNETTDEQSCNSSKSEIDRKENDTINVSDKDITEKTFGCEECDSDDNDDEPEIIEEAIEDDNYQTNKEDTIIIPPTPLHPKTTHSNKKKKKKKRR